MGLQKFKRGDYVLSADGRNDGEAVVIGSYYDQHGGSQDTPNGGHSYTLLFAPDGGQVSWFYESSLTLLRHVGEAGIAEIKAAALARRTQQSGLSWIVANWPEIREAPPGATMDALMAAIGITESWGKHGEGITWYTNAIQTRAVLDGALLTGDIEKVKARIADLLAAVQAPR